MDDAKQLTQWWQSQLEVFGSAFTRPGWRRFAQFVTGTVLCSEQHTITQAVSAIGLEDHWSAMEWFAEYGAWNLREVEQAAIRLIDREHPHHWGRYRVVALDDTKHLRSSNDVWGTCTFRHTGGRSPNSAKRVRAHNWVVMGDLVPGKPWTYLPHTSRLYFRRAQLPEREIFRTKHELATDMLNSAAQTSTRPLLAVFDGGLAREDVIGPGLKNEQHRIEFVTRPRKDARLYKPLTDLQRRAKKRGGRPRKWGDRLPAPQHHQKWHVRWQKGKAFIYGRARAFKWKRLNCHWSVSGPQQLVHVYVFQVQGYANPWYIVTSAMDLKPEQVVEVYAARFRLEDGIRDHKQWLGMQENRAWTKQPILCTFQAQMIAQTILRLLQFKLDRELGKNEWWTAPPWYSHKKHPTILDLRRLLWRHRDRFSKLMHQLEEFEKPPALPKRQQKTLASAA